MTRSTDPRDKASRRLTPNIAAQRCLAPPRFGLAVLLSLTIAFAGVLRAEEGAPERAGEKAHTRIFAAPDENSTVLESAPPGEIIAPVAEMTGAGGSKWFMVKTGKGTVGWIQADGNPMTKKIDGHFRSLPKEGLVIRPAGEAPRTAGRSGTIQVPVQVIGSKVIVPARFNNSISANLLLDTGASRTLISSRIARALGLQPSGSTLAYGIGGYVSIADTRLESLRVGEAETQNLPVGIYDFSPDPSFEGLLGFDFLSRFHMSLDSQKGLLSLTPRQRS